MDVGMKIVFVIYLITLTVLLLSNDPEKIVGVQPLLWHLLKPAVHLLSFLVLGILAMAARWPLACWLLVLCLLAYASGTELLQGPLSRRTPDWADWFQDVAGILIAVAIYRLGETGLHYCRGYSNGEQEGHSGNGKPL